MKYIFYLCSFFCLFGLFSCDGEIDPVKDFTDGEEIRYAGKVQSLSYIPGNNRIAIVFTLSPDPNVNKAVIYWNMKKGSVEMGISDEDHEVGTVTKVIEDMPEDVYSFEMFTMDRFGNTSVPEYLVGKSYGLRYQSSLQCRRIIDYGLADLEGNIQINWADSVLNSAGSELVYTNTKNELVILSIKNTEKATVLTDLNMNKPLQAKTYFIPEGHAIDTFIAEGEEWMIDRSTLTLELAKPYATYFVEGFDTNNRDFGMLWNGQWGKTYSKDNGGNPWADEAGWRAAEISKGSWITFDLKRKVRLQRYRTGFYWPYRRGAPKVTELWGYIGKETPTAEDGWGDKWVKLGSIDNGEFVITEKDMIREYSKGDNIYVDYDKSIEARYYRVKYVDSRPDENGTPVDKVSFSEVTFWQYVD